LPSLRSADGSVEPVHVRHTFGVFSRATWREAFRQAGFLEPDIRPDRWREDVFLVRAEVRDAAACRRPGRNFLCALR
jgi:hypothetical protein